MTTPIPGRPEFGNPEHIKAIKIAAAKEAWKDLPVCEKCEVTGEVECLACSNWGECPECEGSKKDQNAISQWAKQNPGVRPFDMRRV